MQAAMDRGTRRGTSEWFGGVDGRMIVGAAGKRAHADEEFADGQTGIAFQIEESRMILLAEGLRLRREEGHNKNRRSVAGALSRVMMQVA